MARGDYWRGRKRPDMVGNKNPAKRPGVGEKIRSAKSGQVVTPEWRAKISQTLKAKGIQPKTAGWNKGSKHPAAVLAKIRQWGLDNPEKVNYWKGKKQPADMVINRMRTLRGENHYAWISDRSKLSKQDRRGDPAYREWRMKVYKRDGFKCRVSNLGCDGRFEAHHILGWSLYPELRYEINNGITLCHAHHPRKRAEEKRLAPVFQVLVSVSK